MLSARYIIVEGNIGSGKTSLAMLLAGHYQTDVLLEEFADNPFLTMFYENPGRWAFPVELSFLAARYHQMKKVFAKAIAENSIIISDYLFDKSLIFARNNLSHSEIILYETFFDIMNGQIPKPDLIVFIENSIEGLQKNIMKRGRTFENNISRQYLENIDSGYRSFITRNSQVNCLTIDGSRLDFVNDPSHFNQICAEMEFALRYNNNTLFNSK